MDKDEQGSATQRLRNFPMEVVVFALIAIVAVLLARAGYPQIAGLLIVVFAGYLVVSRAKDWAKVGESASPAERPTGQTQMTANDPKRTFEEEKQR